MFLYRLVHKMFIVDDLYKIWKQSKSSLTDEGKTNHELSMYNEILVSNEKEKKPDRCNNLDEPQDHYVE